MPQRTIIDDDDMLDSLTPQRGPDPRIHKATFVGKNAKTADLKALSRAEQMERAGKTKDEIWKQEGWFRGADGEWLAEVSDHEARLKIKPGEATQPGTRMKDALEHKRLYAAYPDLGEMPFSARQLSGDDNAFYNDNGITINTQAPHYKGDKVREMILHEGNHAASDFAGRTEKQIDPREPLAADSSLLAQLHGLPDDPYALYRMSSSENEARAVEKRADLTESERRQRGPWLDFNLPAERQITNSDALFGGTWTDEQWAPFDDWWHELDASGKEPKAFAKTKPAPIPVSPFGPLKKPR